MPSMMSQSLLEVVVGDLVPVVELDDVQKVLSVGEVRSRFVMKVCCHNKDWIGSADEIGPVETRGLSALVSAV